MGCLKYAMIKLFTVVYFIFTSLPVFANSACEMVFFSKDNLTDSDLIKAYQQILNGSQSSKDLLSNIQGSKYFNLFKEHSRDKSIPITIGNYVRYIEDSFDGKSLILKQENALKKNLEKHGIDPQLFVDTSSKDVLKMISKANLKRLAGHLKDAELTDDESILINNITFSFYHFSHNKNKLQRHTPTFSSKSLEFIGLGKGENSQHSFNKKFLSSDDNVFGFVVPQLKTDVGHIDLETEYGRYALVFDNRYATENGWISLFMMYPKQLLEFAKIHHPDVFQRLKELDSYDIEEMFETVDFKGHEQDLIYLRNDLGRFDFTVDDFNLLVKTRLTEVIHNLKKENRIDEYNQIIQALTAGKSSDLNLIVTKYIYIPLGLKLHPHELVGTLEFKIPVAVPSEMIFQTDATGPN